MHRLVRNSLLVKALRLPPTNGRNGWIGSIAVGWAKRDSRAATAWKWAGYATGSIIRAGVERRRAEHHGGRKSGSTVGPPRRAGVRRSACRVAARSGSRPSWHVSWWLPCWRPCAEPCSPGRRRRGFSWPWIRSIYVNRLTGSVRGCSNA